MQEALVSVGEKRVISVYSVELNEYSTSDSITEIGKMMIKGLKDIYM